MRTIQIYEISQKEVVLAPAIDAVEFREYNWRPGCQSFQPILDETKNIADPTVEFTSYSEPVFTFYTEGSNGVRKELYFVIGPHLRNLMQWDLSMRDMNTRLTQVKCENMDLRKSLEVTCKKLDDRQIVLTEQRNRIAAFAASPWWKRMWVALIDPARINLHG